MRQHRRPWVPVEFDHERWRHGDVHHWGTNILSFLKQDGRWRVSAIADNGRTGPRPVDWDRA